MELKFSNEWLKKRIEKEAEYLDCDCGNVDEPQSLPEMTPVQFETELLNGALKYAAHQLKKTEARLKAYEEGVDIEDAVKYETYIYYHHDAIPVIADWSNVDKQWTFIHHESIHHIESGPLYPLPPTEQEKGGE